MKILFLVIGCVMGIFVGKLVIWIVKLWLDNKYLKQEVELYKSSISTRDFIIEQKNKVIKDFIEQASRQQYSTFTYANIPQGTIEAVKYAMKKSRPDNGGNAEDFIKFQKVYEELTRKYLEMEEN